MQAANEDFIVDESYQSKRPAADRLAAVDVQSQCCLEDTREETGSQNGRAISQDTGMKEAALEHCHGASGSGWADEEPVPHPSPPIHTPGPASNIPNTPVQLHNTQGVQSPVTEELQPTRHVGVSGNPRLTQRTKIDTDCEKLSISTLASSSIGLSNSDHNITSAPHSVWTQPGTSADTTSQTFRSTTSKPPRPTSVPIITSNSSSMQKSRDGTGYPRYPDQSFAALQSQHCPPSTRPHSTRTRSSHPSQNSSFSSIPSRTSRDHIAMVTGARTVGNTPAQSPGLFSPVYPASRSQIEESEDSQTSTPLLHPAHMQTPKE